MKKEIAAFITAGLLVSGGYGAAAQNETGQAAVVQHGMVYISVVDAAKPETGAYNAWESGGSRHGESGKPPRIAMERRRYFAFR